MKTGKPFMVVATFEADNIADAAGLRDAITALIEDASGAVPDVYAVAYAVDTDKQSPEAHRDKLAKLGLEFARSGRG